MVRATELPAGHRPTAGPGRLPGGGLQSIEVKVVRVIKLPRPAAGRPPPPRRAAGRRRPAECRRWCCRSRPRPAPVRSLVPGGGLRCAGRIGRIKRKISKIKAVLSLFHMINNMQMTLQQMIIMIMMEWI